MRALILCAGQGSRLRPLTNERPKCMVPLLGRPLFDYQIDTLASCGISDVSLVTGYASEHFEQTGYQRFHNSSFATTNMVTSLFKASDMFDGSTDLIIGYSDIVYERKVLQPLIDCDATVATAIDVGGWLELWNERMDDPLSDVETLKFNTDGTLSEIGHKPDTYDDIEGQYIGLIKIAREAQADVLAFYNGLDRSGTYDGQPFANMYMTSFIQGLIDAGQSVLAARTSGGWLEVDTIQDLEKYESLHTEGRLPHFWQPTVV